MQVTRSEAIAIHGIESVELLEKMLVNQPPHTTLCCGKVCASEDSTGVISFSVRGSYVQATA